MMRDAICGIAHLHAQGYMHCDIKSLNFLVAEVSIVFIFCVYACGVMITALDESVYLAAVESCFALQRLNGTHPLAALHFRSITCYSHYP